MVLIILFFYFLLRFPSDLLKSFKTRPLIIRFSYKHASFACAGVSFRVIAHRFLGARLATCVFLVLI